MSEGKVYAIDDFPFSEVPENAQILTRTVYARKLTLSRGGGRLFGAFETDFTFCCGSAIIKEFVNDAVISIVDAGRCPSGEEVVAVTVR